MLSIVCYGFEGTDEIFYDYYHFLSNLLYNILSRFSIFRGKRNHYTFKYRKFCKFSMQVG